MALDWQNYLNANPDVMQEYAKSSTFQLDPGNASGRFINPVSEEAFAKAHYDQFGKKEGRLWGAAPNTGTTSNTGTTMGGTTAGTTTGTTANVTLPGMSNTNVPDWINSLGKSIPNYFDAYKSSTELPGKIDEWMQNSINRQRMTGDQVKSIFSQVGNQRAGSGIMGGTEYDNSVATLTSNLAKIFEENQGNIEMTGNQMKANAISGLPTQAMAGINALTSLYGANAADQQNWAQLAAQMINSSY